jgi:hypothetical protein
MEAAQAYRDAQDTLTRYYALSERAIVVIRSNRNNDWVHEIFMSVESASDEIYMSSLWPGDMRPAELVKCSEIKSMLDDWIGGRLDVLPPSTATPRDPDCDV